MARLTRLVREIGISLALLTSSFKATCLKCSHIAVPSLDGLANHRCRDLIADLDVPHFTLALRGEVDEQLRDC
jgi:hypothetical protein